MASEDLRGRNISEGLRALGGIRSPGHDSFAIERNGRTVEVRYTTDSDDDVTALTLFVRYDRIARPHGTGSYRTARRLRATRPLGIELTTERDGHVRAKDSGLVREWQSGDDYFDEHVFVTSPGDDPEVFAAVLGPEARRGAVALLSYGFETVGVDVDGEVFAKLGRSAFVRERGANGQERATLAVDAFLDLVANLPELEATGRKHSAPPLGRLTRALGLLGIAGWATNVVFLGGVHLALVKLFGFRDTDLGSSTGFACFGAAIVGGLLGARLYGELLAKRLRGRSDALDRLARGKLAAFGGFSVLTFALAYAAALHLAG